MFKRLYNVLVLVAALALALPSQAFASIEVPNENSKVKYFYVFGSGSDPYVGAEDNELTLVVDVPEAETGNVSIKVYDPDTSKQRDYRMSYDNAWDTATSFTVSGASQLAEMTTAAGDDSYDRKSYEFGPYAKTQGQKVGNFYRFRLQVKGVSGDDGNLFNVKVSPESADVYSENITFRLRSSHGSKMYFYPGIQKGTSKITVHNYDLDADGGVSHLEDPYTGQTYEINDSLSAQWSKTDINLADGPARRLKYVIKKQTQKSAHAGLKFTDGSGKPLPIYFRKGSLPVVKKPAPKPVKAPLSCNQFTFDGRKSYDDDNDKITYEWDLGDGTTSTAPVVSHTYNKGGRYQVRLTVTDNSGLKCETANTTQWVDVNTPPTAAFDAQDVCVGQDVRLDASASSDDQTKDLKYAWNFGDGTSGDGKSVTKSYSQGGSYKVDLTVDDGAGSSCSVDSVSKVINVNAAPVANAGDDVELCLTNPLQDYNVSLNGSGSHDPDRNDLDYSWNFGDGNSGSGSRVSHTYEKGGEYTARLTVRDNSGSSCSVDSDTVKIKLSKAPVAIAGKDRYACAGTSIKFDGSESYGEAGQALTYAWDFGDGATGSGKVAEHRYAEGGNYTAVLKVSNGNDNPSCSEAMDAVKVHINSGPNASIDKVEASCVGDKVSFDASGSSDPDGNSLRYTWDFGDGTVKEGGSRVSHGYKKGGTYKVAVTVDDGSGSPCATSTATTYVKVNTPPVADAGPNLVCCEGENNTFNASGSSDADGDKLTYNWTFGDGATDQGARVSHTYNERGVYNVAVTVDDGTGTRCSTATDSFQANVNTKPVPIIKVQQG